MTKRTISFGYFSQQFVQSINDLCPTFYEEYDYEILNKNGNCSEEQMIEAFKKCEVFVGIRPITSAHLENAPNLKLIVTISVGYDHIDIEACKKKGIYVGYSPLHAVESTSDHALSLILATARQLYKGNKYIQDGRWTKINYEICLGRNLAKKTVGFIGFGKIGQCLAKKLYFGWGAKVLYHCTADKNIENYEFVGDVNDLFARCQIITVHLPYNKKTHHYINKEQFNKIQLDNFGKGIIFVNTSRGPIVDENALVEALNVGKVWGAGLDVFENEPKIHTGLVENENCFLTPHIGGSTIEGRYILMESILSNIKGYFKSGRPKYLVEELN
ncbi:2-hydroxyacid dehydrogenase-related [Anaeramoeba flamelloides]|uniref:2-hydroxyacid dehydrogenase-related n=1 Tax=Anaeramoeba flamelloides TaxID=1746091 RepID=A0AAV7YVI7_9EUKA|nr:2-hydroxyacid dehydrogenase-related [Anaeramoeba flamelloides]KAJ6254290.1 2-hydroxyacid dehydrogenase-related [Anaeramoeba flamelloides]|eukprot:Anaeramoba_flamelloidesa350483_36.p1 GENE.a350483_36~~a350483_36.p1  ORF type:complete len:347 (+),score=40.30 a350483_36:52-1041(+)